MSLSPQEYGLIMEIAVPDLAKTLGCSEEYATRVLEADAQAIEYCTDLEHAALIIEVAEYERHKTLYHQQWLLRKQAEAEAGLSDNAAYMISTLEAGTLEAAEAAVAAVGQAGIQAAYEAWYGDGLRIQS